MRVNFTIAPSFETPPRVLRQRTSGVLDVCQGGFRRVAYVDAIADRQIWFSARASIGDERVDQTDLSHPD